MELEALAREVLEDQRAAGKLNPPVGGDPRLRAGPELRVARELGEEDRHPAGGEHPPFGEALELVEARCAAEAGSGRPAACEPRAHTCRPRRSAVVGLADLPAVARLREARRERPARSPARHPGRACAPAAPGTIIETSATTTITSEVAATRTTRRYTATGQDCRERDRHGYHRPARAVSSAGRAPALQAGGRPFEPGTAHSPFACKRRSLVDAAARTT